MTTGNLKKYIVLGVLTLILLFTSPAFAAQKCLIKGNVSRSKGIVTKIYHLPDTRYYKSTKIVAKEGDKWFCSEKDAKKAGFRKAK